MKEQPKPQLIENKQLTEKGMLWAFWKLLAGRGGMTISASELANMPANAQLKAVHDPVLDSFTITAIVGQAPNQIIVPTKRVIGP
jgi:hypothetical protein